MEAEGLGDGPQLSPKGLRHDFDVTNGIPLNMIQKWLGHAQLSITAIYADVVDAEEKSIASRMWRRGRTAGGTQHIWLASIRLTTTESSHGQRES